MNVSLLRKRYNTPIIPFLLLLLFYGDVVRATPACPIITQSFQNSANGALSDPSATGWYLDATAVPNAVVFSAQSHRIKAQTLGGEGVWYSQVFSIAGYTDVQVDAKISSEGTFTSSEYVKVYYKLNNGPETLISAQYGSFGTPTVKSPMLTGNTVQIVIRIYNVSVGNNDYYIENYDVFKETGPCTVSGISVSASATNSGVLTCNNPNTTLSASTSASGTTTYSWTGPNGSTATGSSISVNTAGTYTVTGTNSAGTGTASVTVTANNSAPDLAATGANLGCATSVTISSSSSVSGATYSWTGPNGFTSQAQNPSVTAAGTYTVTVKNPATGCTAQKQVTVTSGTPTATTFWLEDFTFANGTTSDAGTTPWTSSSTGTGTYTYSVQNNEFKTTFTGQQVGTWTSGSISLSGKTNTVLSIDLRSETPGSNDVFENSDYIRVYLRINNRADSLIFEDQAGVGTSTFGTVSTTISSGAFNGDSVRVIVKTSNSDPTERYYFDNVKLTGTPAAAATITASVSGIATCSSPAQLSVTVGGTVTAYSWTGPNNFTSSLQNPAVTAGGQYTVTATLSGGCTVSAPVTVTENKTAPDLTASGASLACASSVTISASSSVSGATYSWSGPNSFTSNAQNPVVSATGTYTVTVTNPANGCTASQPVTVASGVTSLWLENFTFSNGTTSDAGTTPWSVQSTPSGSVASVQSNEFRVSNTGTATGSESVWASGTIDISGKTNVSISAGIRSSVVSGAAMNNSGSTMDYIRFYYKLNGGSEVLFNDNVAGVNNHATTNTIISVGSLSGTSLQIIVRARATGSDEFYYFDNVQVSANDQSNISAIASAGGTLTCTNSSVALSGNATTAGVTYSWTGPNGFSSAVQNPTATAAGIYTLTVSAGGCTASDTALVSQNITVPDLSATGAALGCLTSTTISANSSVSGATYSWSGPNGFTSAAKNPVVSVAGAYIATVTNPANGCTASQSVTVTSSATSLWLENFTFSNGTTSDAGTTPWSVQSTPSGSVFSVQNNEFRVSNTGTATGSESVWASGTIDISGKTNVSISAGIRSSVTNNAAMNNSGSTMDYIRFYYKLNGGSEVLFSETLAGVDNHNTVNTTISVGSLSGTSLQIIVRARATGSDEFYYFDNVQVSGISNINATASAGGILSCTNASVALTGNSSATGVNYSWTGPNNFTSNTQNPTVTTAGIYTLTVTNPATGCSGTDTANVISNTTVPNAVTASATNSLSCTRTSVGLTGASSTTGVLFSWTGPNGFTSAVQNPTVTAGGIYTLTVTNPASGCTATDTANVLSNTTVPAGVTTISDPANATLTCTVNFIDLSASSTTPGVLYSWSGPNVNAGPSTSSFVTVFSEGAYQLTVSNPSNGCVTTANVTVLKNQTFATDLTITPNVALLTCANPTVNLTGSSSTAGASYSWTGPNGYTAIGTNAVANAPGAYVLMVVNNANGCVTTTTATVNQNRTVPTGVSAFNDGPLSCNKSSVTLTGGSTSGDNYSWTGPGNFTSTSPIVSVSTPGTYTLTATSTVSGCTASANTIVALNTAGPGNLVVSSNIGGTVLSCTNPSLTLTASSSTSGASYSWSGPNGFSSSLASVTINTIGAYIVTATDPLSGCSSTNTTQITQNILVPDNVSTTSVPSNALLSCTQHSVTLTGNSSTPGVNYQWSGPSGPIANSSVITITGKGDYVLTVTEPNSGCKKTATATVTEDLTAPASVNAIATNQLTCAQHSAKLTGSSGTGGVSYAWTGPNGFTSNLQEFITTVPGSYTVTATHPTTGCTSSKIVVLQQNITAPQGVSIAPPDMLTCDVTSVDLVGSSSTTGVRYAWSGPDDFSDNVATTSVSEPGDYQLTVTNPLNGCTSTASVTVEQDITECETVVRKVTSGTAANMGSTGTGSAAPVAGFTYKVYPNPVSSAAFVDLSSPVSAHVEVSLYNSMGVREKLLFNGVVEANRAYKLSINAGGFATGVHFCIIKVDGKVYSSKLLFTPGQP